MIGTIALLVGLLILIVIIKATYTLHHQMKNAKLQDDESIVHKVAIKQNIAYTLLVTVSILCIFLLYYFFIKKTIYESHFFEWLNLIIRWIHITFGIAWIGASFYFVFLENALNRTKDVRDELAGNLWAIHGGGFYYLEKYKLAPKKIPKELHWFKYEAYFTWLTGFCLLFVVYYFNAKSFLIDPEVMDLKPITAITIGVVSLIFGWAIYDYLCKNFKQNHFLYTYRNINMRMFCLVLYASI